MSAVKPLRRNLTEHDEASFGGRLLAAAAQNLDACVREWACAKFWADVGERDYRSGTLIGADVRAARFTFVDDRERRRHDVVAKRVFPMNPTLLDDTDDLTALSHLHEPAVLHHLRQRFEAGNIYTFSGPILVALNPYKRLDTSAAFEAALVRYTSGSDAGGPRLPHAYAIGDQAYRAMRAFGQSQSILVTGESGAGKTETTKILLQYFASKGGAAASAAAASIEARVLGTTPILESFGNAKTLRNDNSSRFGKFILVDFDRAGRVTGAQLRTYLLEKSRLTYQAAGERNYHVFYQLLDYCAEEPDGLPGARAWRLLRAADYRYLNTNGTGAGLYLDGVDSEAAHFRVTMGALRAVGVSAAEFEHVCGLLVALLALGNVTFVNNAKDEAHVDAAGAPRDWLREAAALLGVPADGLLACMTTRKIVANRSESYTKHENAAFAEVARDSLAVFLYEALFTWLVDRINAAVRSPGMAAAAAAAAASPRSPLQSPRSALVVPGQSPQTPRARGLSAAAARAPPPETFIGILDIYGFESFAVNSLEQFCINYANEKLQQQFNQHMFKLEQEEYHREGIDWSDIEFADNAACIALIEGGMGIIDLLNEQSRLGQATGETFVQAMSKTARRSHYEAAKSSAKPLFLVRHYAGKVEYDASAFVEKNRNTPPLDFLNLVLDSAAPRTGTPALVRALCAVFDDVRKQPATAGRRETLVTQFKDSLTELMGIIATTQPNYIRCIKPNDYKQPLVFTPLRVVEQLNCGGVMEAIRIAQAGYPTRVPYRQFCLRYRPFVPVELRRELSVLAADASAAEAARTLVARAVETMGAPLAALPEQVKFGKTKIFIKAGVLGHLEELMAAHTERAAVVLQSHIRRTRAATFFARVRAGLTALQALWRRHAARKRLRVLVQARAASLVQALARGYLARAAYARMARERRAALVVQRCVRGARARAEYTRRRRALVVIQAHIRARDARQELAVLRKEARSLAGVMARVKPLEARVASLSAELAQANAAARECEHLRSMQEALEHACAEGERRLQALAAEASTKDRLWQSRFEQKAAQLKEAKVELLAGAARLREASEAHEKALAAERAHAAGLAARISVLEDEVAERAQLQRQLEAEREVSRHWREEFEALERAEDAALAREIETASRVQAELTQSIADLDERTQRLEQMQREVSDACERIERAAAVDARLRQEAEDTARALHAAELERARDEGDRAWRARFAALEQQLHERDEALRNAQETLGACRADTERARTDLAERSSELERTRRELAQAITAMKQLARDVDAVRNDAANQYASKLDAFQAAHAQALLAEAQRADELDAQLTVAHTRLAATEEQLQARQIETEAECQALERAVQEHAAEARAARAETEALRAKLVEQARVAADDLKRLKQQYTDQLQRAEAAITEAREQAERVERECAEREAHSANTMGAIMAEIDALRTNETAFHKRMASALVEVAKQRRSDTASMMEAAEDKPPSPPDSSPGAATHGALRASRMDEALDSALAAYGANATIHASKLTHAVLACFMPTESASPVARAATSAAVILARWLLRRGRDAHDPCIAHTLRRAALRPRTLNEEIWLFNTAAALYAFSTQLTGAETPAELTFRVTWPKTPATADRRRRRSDASKPKRDRADVRVAVPDSGPAANDAATLAGELQVAATELYGRVLRPLVAHARAALRAAIGGGNAIATQDMRTLASALMTELQAHLDTLQERCVYPAVLRQFIGSFFAVVDATVFNSLLEPPPPPRCTFAVATAVKLNLIHECGTRLGAVVARLGPGIVQRADMAPDVLFRYTVQLVNVLLLDKAQLVNANTRAAVCPDLTVAQLWHVCRRYVADADMNEPPIPARVVAALRHDRTFDGEDAPYVFDEAQLVFSTRAIHMLEVVDVAQHEVAHELMVEVLTALTKK